MKIDYTKKDAKIVKASKELVDQLLEINTENRREKKRHTEWISDAINEGNFILTGQGISVSNTGKLIDGQHRLMAIREAGYPAVELLLVTGLEDKARIYIDQHAKRSTTDMLKVVLNQSTSTKMAAVVNTHLKLHITKNNIAFKKGAKPQLEEIVETMESHFDFLSMLASAAGRKPRAGIMCAYFHYGLRYNEDAALSFAEKVGLGERLDRNEAAYRLRSYVIGGSRRTTYGSAGQLMDYKNAVTACIAHANSEELVALRPANSWEGLPPKAKRYHVAAAIGKAVATGKMVKAA